MNYQLVIYIIVFKKFWQSILKHSLNERNPFIINLWIFATNIKGMFIQTSYKLFASFWQTSESIKAIKP